MLAWKVKNGTDKLGITVNVEVNLYLCFVASCVFERNYTYVHRRLLNISDHNGTSEFVLPFFFLPVFTILLGHYMKQPYGDKNVYLKNIF